MFNENDVYVGEFANIIGPDKAANDQVCAILCLFTYNHEHP